MFLSHYSKTEGVDRVPQYLLSAHINTGEACGHLGPDASSPSSPTLQTTQPH